VDGVDGRVPPPSPGGGGGGVPPTSTVIEPSSFSHCSSAFFSVSSHLSRALKVLSVYSVFNFFVLLRCVAACGRFRVCLVSAVIVVVVFFFFSFSSCFWLCCPKRFLLVSCLRAKETVSFLSLLPTRDGEVSISGGFGTIWLPLCCESCRAGLGSLSTSLCRLFVCRLSWPSAGLFSLVFRPSPAPPWDIVLSTVSHAV
jgi:hypothetical protein